MHVRTLGGLAIEAGPGDGLPPALGPRRLALLAILASAGSRGITREKIIGILWPETDEEQSRHTLSQALYLLRRDTGRPWVAGTALLRLHESITSDAAQFQDALDANQLERAASLYAGAFLDGFYLAGAPGFEQWVESTRARMQSAALKVFEALARQADGDGRFAEAVGWWRRLGDVDPFSTEYAAGRIRALIAAGDRPSALRFAREYETRIRRELESEPAPMIAELSAAIRAVDPPPTPLPAAATGGTATPPVAGVTSPARSGTHLRYRTVIGALLVTVAAAVAFTISQTRSPRALPFLAIGTIQAPDSAPLGPLLRDMLATNLGRIDGIQVVANSRLVELLGRRSDAEPGAAADAARRAGATEIIEGELSVSASGMAMTLRRVAVESGVVRHGYSVRAADAFTLTDSATAAIALDLGLDVPPDGVARVRTRSAVAYALYEQGLRAMFEGDGPATRRLMMAALERDSTFAMAAFHARAYGTHEEAEKLLPLVTRLAATAVDRERLFIHASLAGEGAPLSDYLRAARDLTDRYPDDTDALLLLAGALALAGDRAGSISVLDRAVAIDSAAGAFLDPYCHACGVLYSMALQHVWSDSAAAAERVARRIIAFRPDHPSGWESLVEPLMRQGRRVEAEAAIAQATRVKGARPNVDWLLERDLIRSGRLEELEARLVSRLQNSAPTEWGESPWLLAFVLRNQGRLREAYEYALSGVLPLPDAPITERRDDITLAIVALERGNAGESARRFLDMAAADRASDAPAGVKARNTAWHMTLAGTALAEAGDTAAVRVLADSVEQIGWMSSFGRDFRLHFFLRGLLLQRENRHDEAVHAFRRSLFSVTDGYTRINLELARSLVDLGRYSEAIAILQPALRGGVDGGNTYVTHTELHEALARAFTAAGQADSAAVHYAAVEQAWRRADPQFSDRYLIAKNHAAGATQRD